MNAMLRQRRKDDEMRAQGTEGSNEVPLPNAGSCTGCLEDPRTQCPHIKASKDFWRCGDCFVPVVWMDCQAGGKTRTSEQAHGEGKAFLWGALKEPSAVKIFH